MEVNQSVIDNFEEYSFTSQYSSFLPDYANVSELSEAEIAVWTNRVPEKEPWPRVLKQDNGDTVNEENDGYKDNVDWIDQFNNIGEDGRKPIGRVEGDEEIERKLFWRR